MNVLGLKIVGHDTGASVISNGRVVAIAEERLNREKYSGVFPRLSIEYCLKALELRAEDIDLIVADQIDHVTKYPVAEILTREVGARFSRAKIVVANHHDTHAASAFFCSPFDEAAVMVYDGSGEKFLSPLGVPVTETETMYIGRGNELIELQKGLHTRIGKYFPFTFGVGKLYEFITVYLGFTKFDAGKTMGLAPYGNEDVLRRIPEEHWWTEWRGQCYCNAQIRHPARVDVSSSGGTSLLGRIMVKLRMVSRRAFAPLAKLVSGEYAIRSYDLFKPLQLPEPPRGKEVQLPDTYYANVAFAVQTVLEHVVKQWARRAQRLTGSTYLCIAGGVGLNSVANTMILKDCGFKDIWVQPACSDTGVAFGCALWGYHQVLKQPRFMKMDHAYLGREYSKEEVHKALEQVADRITWRTSTDIAKETARYVADKKIVGFFQGGSEYGPRALGHRSIIVDARDPQMKDILNARVKKREGWRPFAASVLDEMQETYFEIEPGHPASAFMLLVAAVKERQKSIIPSAVHVDGTCRLQTVSKQANGIYYDVIKAFHELTGVGLVVNTSYNLAGEPIVESPEDTLRTFLATDMDVLVMNDVIITKK